MHPDHHIPTRRDLPPAVGVVFLGLTLQQLREWEAKGAMQFIVPKRDAQAWEDTEIDVRKTSL